MKWIFFIVSIGGLAPGDARMIEMDNQTQCQAAIRVAGTKYFSSWRVGPNGEVILADDVAAQSYGSH